MIRQKRSPAARIGIDILGFLFVIAAGLTGWLPGPGGIPLLILGLSLLATNHEWAERILLYVKDHGFKFLDKFFDGSPRVKLLIDIAGIVTVALGVFLVVALTQSRAKTAAISLFVVSLVLLLGNRKRAQSLRKKLRRK